MNDGDYLELFYPYSPKKTPHFSLGAFSSRELDNRDDYDNANNNKQ